MNSTATPPAAFAWFVGSPTGIRTRICFDSPSGAHPLTPERIRARYTAEICNAALLVWRLPDSGLGGIRAGLDEVTWRDAEIVSFETSFCRPAKGSGNILLTAQRRDNLRPLPLLLSDQYEPPIHGWHKAAAALLERAYPGLTCVRDAGYDA
jgi:hypothetical protein